MRVQQIPIYFPPCSIGQCVGTDHWFNLIEHKDPWKKKSQMGESQSSDQKLLCSSPFSSFPKTSYFNSCPGGLRIQEKKKKKKGSALSFSTEIKCRSSCIWHPKFQAQNSFSLITDWVNMEGLCYLSESSLNYRIGEQGHRSFLCLHSFIRLFLISTKIL